ncbi:BON domain-containing protein [Paraburkholderia strydomiana]|jgi:osmotically-inducible protein OsmY|uniref:BON domain-containing protein n=1 Tax=Paraburkholderia TaxID=1822464 RepID=UPI0038B80344
MNYIRKNRLFLGALMVFVSFSANAEVAGDATPTASSVVMRTKTVKAADRTLQRNVRRALAKTKGLNIANLTVRARDGCVMLEGSVPEQSQSDLAAQVASAVVGVKSLKNALTLRPIQ